MICCPNCSHEFQPDEKPVSGMTPRQKDLLEFIRSYSSESGGIAPSYDEMKNAIGVASKSGINRLVCGLEERGLIRRLKQRERSIVVIGETA